MTPHLNRNQLAKDANGEYLEDARQQDNKGHVVSVPISLQNVEQETDGDDKRGHLHQSHDIMVVNEALCPAAENGRN